MAAIKSAYCTFHNLDAFHICHVQAGEIHIVHCFACQLFSIYHEEDALTTKAT